jgi:hypothetical protein
MTWKGKRSTSFVIVERKRKIFILCASMVGNVIEDPGVHVLMAHAIKRHFSSLG